MNFTFSNISLTLLKFQGHSSSEKIKIPFCLTTTTIYFINPSGNYYISAYQIKICDIILLINSTCNFFQMKKDTTYHYLWDSHMLWHFGQNLWNILQHFLLCLMHVSSRVCRTHASNTNQNAIICKSRNDIALYFGEPHLWKFTVLNKISGGAPSFQMFSVVQHLP